MTNIDSFLNRSGGSRAVLDLLTAATRALNAYADNAGVPTIQYVVTNHATGPNDSLLVSTETVQTLHHRDKMQKGTD